MSRIALPMSFRLLISLTTSILFESVWFLVSVIRFHALQTRG